MNPSGTGVAIVGGSDVDETALEVTLAMATVATTTAPAITATRFAEARRRRWA
jgi:hypothetical protein